MDSNSGFPRKRPFRYRVSLRVTHPSWSHYKLADHVGLSPKYAWSVGDAHPFRSPDTPPKIRRHSYCSFEIGHGDDGELTSLLEQTLNEFANRDTKLRAIQMSGGDVSFYVFWCPNGDTGETFDVALLRRMSSMGIGLDINVYDDRRSFAWTCSEFHQPFRFELANDR